MSYDTTRTAIRATDISKRYRLGSREENDDTLAGAMMHLFSRPLRNLRGLRRLSRFDGPSRDESDVIWALRNVSFEVRQGEAVGLIGSNGAGKSTLLKVLTRITDPTEGAAELFGRVSSLLEVGTGFHPELTGRENIFLNGAVLGMTRREIIGKFDEIVEFSGVERFIDTPVKRYSSGMKVRLAFSVAAHMEPEILLVDEVLAVGDDAFQKKCMGKMGDVASRGRTVIFVSHNLSAITRLCQRALLLEDGAIVADGPAESVVAAYLNGTNGSAAVREWDDPRTAPGGDIARLRAVRVRTAGGRIADTVDIRQPMRVEMEYEVLQDGYVLQPNFWFTNGDQGVCAFGANDLDPQWRKRPRPAGRYVSTVWVPGNLLSEGMMFVDANLITTNPFIVQFEAPNAVAFQVVDSMEGDSARGDWAGPMHGAVRPKLDWTTEVPTGRGARIEPSRVGGEG